jgi:membrane protein CcdC involved in cytochrome C biogenesis
MSKSTESLSEGLNTLTKNPSLLFPSIAPIIVQLLFAFLANVIFPVYGWTGSVVLTAPNFWLNILGSLIASIVGFIASCMIVDMSNDAINQNPVDLKKSMNVVTARLGTLIVAAIIAAICAITIILIPVALFIVTISILEGLDAVASAKKAFDFVVKNLGEVIVYIIIVIIVSAIVSLGFGSIPFVGLYLAAIIRWIMNVYFTVVSVHFYLSLGLSPTPPPPPPPPPPP